MTASRDAAAVKGTVAPEGAPSKDLPPALAAMMEERRADAVSAAETAKRESVVELPPTTWREIQGRAIPLGLIVELSSNGSELGLMAELPQASVEG
jgi:hypothetical protein